MMEAKRRIGPRWGWTVNDARGVGGLSRADGKELVRVLHAQPEDCRTASLSGSGFLQSISGPNGSAARVQPRSAQSGGPHLTRDWANGTRKHLSRAIESGPQYGCKGYPYKPLVIRCLTTP